MPTPINHLSRLTAQPVMLRRGEPEWNPDTSSALSPRYLYENQTPRGVVPLNQLQNYDAMPNEEFGELAPDITRRLRPEVGYEFGTPGRYPVPPAERPLPPNISYEQLLRLLQERWGER